MIHMTYDSTTGFGDVKVLVHDEKTGQSATTTAAELTPPPPGAGAGFLTHDEFE